ncbi:ubiquitin-like FUBI-ribosomal protein eS30 fusion protein [Phlebotomus argentipes]|uniref:ubiquitin-like FUBI-ribosomal protein eS30 fusion protein n=1 Tax=Phlebotomus argentipes TaxID=94469 RepID=UPI0028936A2E|nr:ubiquitin-like FUBI-ribosomal protein eS30 fusion protein [Phlebotomus argentipes]
MHNRPFSQRQHYFDIVAILSFFFDVWCLETRLIMQLYIRGEKTHVLNVEISDTIGELKAKLAILSSEECEDICLTCEGTPLTNDSLVSSLTSCELDLTLPLLGGKVHGSLARAGKVKGQTPKVDKQEKKKKKTGRAKRRIQYNRRFVNVVQSFGRRRGPNAKS